MGRGRLAGEGADPVTDDEAFIRAIVASPGDDLSRLVYADYLDERGDPRGTYLRAEVDTVRAYHETRDTGERIELNTTFAALNPVWVARVSRPPRGVCCDHLTFTDSGKLLTTEDIDHAAGQLGVAFPLQLQAFLLNHNGGVLSNAGFISNYLIERGPVEEWRDDPLNYTVVGHFLGIARSFVDDLVDAALSLRPRRLPANLIPVAVIPDAESLVLTKAGRRGGQMYLWEDVEGEPFNLDRLSCESETLANFLAVLTSLPNKLNQR